MTVYRVEKDRNYTVVDNGFIDDPSISRKAKGILLYFLRLPADWKIYPEEIEKHATDGINSLRSGMNELKDMGYVKRYPLKDKKGVITERETVIYEKKQGANVENSPHNGFPQVDSPQVGFPQVENRTLLNTNNTKYLYRLNTDNIKGVDDEEVAPASMRDRVISKWNSLDKNIPRLQALTEGTSRYKYLRARINEYGLNRVLEAVDMISKSKFLQGYVTDFVINFDWFIKPNNFIKVLEGNYSDKTEEIEDISNHQESSQQVQEPKKQESTDVEDFIERKRREWIEAVKKERSLDD